MPHYIKVQALLSRYSNLNWLKDHWLQLRSAPFQGPQDERTRDPMS